MEDLYKIAKSLYIAHREWLGDKDFPDKKQFKKIFGEQPEKQTEKSPFAELVNLAKEKIENALDAKGRVGILVTQHEKGPFYYDIDVIVAVYNEPYKASIKNVFGSSPGLKHTDIEVESRSGRRLEYVERHL